MNCLIDERSNARIAAHLRAVGQDATTVAANPRPGLSDREVLSIAYAEERVFITDHRDFGEHIFRYNSELLSGPCGDTWLNWNVAVGDAGGHEVLPDPVRAA